MGSQSVGHNQAQHSTYLSYRKLQGYFPESYLGRADSARGGLFWLLHMDMMPGGPAAILGHEITLSGKVEQCWLVLLTPWLQQYD